MQAALIFGLDNWVVTPRMEQNLGGFYHRVVRRIMGDLPKIWKDGGWEYLPISESLREVGL